jgi:signal transduction histidine kinase
VNQEPRSPAAFLARRLATIAAVALATAAAIWALGLGARVAVLGADTGVMRTRVEAAVRQAVDREAAAARAHADAVAALNGIDGAVQGDARSVRQLFDALGVSVAADAGTEATSIYGSDGLPIAWAGRPSDIATDRIRAGGEDWLVLEQVLGLRLVHIRPVERRLGAVVVTERAIGVTSPATAMASLRGSGPDPYRLATRWATVSLEASSGGDAGTSPDSSRFEILGPHDRPLVTASVANDALARTRAQWSAAIRWLMLAVVAIALLFAAGAVLDWHAMTAAAHPGATAAVLLLCVAAGRAVLLAEPAGGWSSLPLFTAVTYASPTVPRLLASPFDFLLTAVAVTAAVLVVLQWVETARRRQMRRRAAVTAGDLLQAAGGAALAGAGAALVLAAHAWLLRDTVAHSTVDLLHFSLAPFSPARLALQLGLIALHAAAVAAAVALFRASTIPWLVPRWSAHQAAIVAAWTVPTVLWVTTRGGDARDSVPLPALALALAVVLTLIAGVVWARYRNGSQAFRLLALALAPVVPALAFYPTLFAMAWRAKSDLVETRYAPQALNQRATVYALLEESLREIDGLPGLTALISANVNPGETGAASDRAFQVWQATALARYPVTSSVEVYGPDGRLVSRFAFNLPEDLTNVSRSDETTCGWTVAEEVAPFFADERRVYHAGRALCEAGGAIAGSIVVHAMLDYENLPFTAARTPYVELLQPSDAARGPDAPGDDVQYAVYGWSRTPLYSSHETAWPLDDPVFALVEQSRDSVWARLRRNGEPFDVFLMNDRGGIYALGFPAVSPLGHLVNLAELTTLGATAFVGVAVIAGLFGLLARRFVVAQALLREVRASFYRKLFLAFVAAVVAPVALLAVVARTFVASEMRVGVEREALRTSAAASRVVSDLIAPQAARLGSALDDNLMVWVRRLIDEDANIFAGTELQATSERTVFASGLLSSRTPAEVYGALALRREGGAVARERIGDFEYVVAAAPIRLGTIDAMMTVPLTSRQRDIDSQIDALDRRVLLAALIFILAGAGLGYTMAERIADPVSRLTRATRRIAGGDFDVRVVSTSSDELARLVADFNQMAAELQRQRRQLERTHRIEAWAEMARQVAHDIKNPLTPIQLNAEHLRRVHADRGEPLGPILKECVETILTQVALLRQISSEFSNFASSPNVRRAPVEVADLLRDLVAPYGRGLTNGVSIEVRPMPPLPPVLIDRALVSRSLTNVIENALHAMPSGGRLTIEAALRDSTVAIAMTDTGMGMDQEALERVFEPYFSTKARGTGLGLPIAKRNVELSGGTIAITSRRDEGTTVEVRLPVAS